MDLGRLCEEVVGKLFLLENCGQKGSLCIVALGWVRLCLIRKALVKGVWGGGDTRVFPLPVRESVSAPKCLPCPRTLGPGHLSLASIFLLRWSSQGLLALYITLLL